MDAGIQVESKAIRRKLKPSKEGEVSSAGQKTAMWIVCAIFVIYSFTLVYPFYYLFINSFKDNYYLMIDPFGLPEKENGGWLIENYKTVFTEFNMGEMFYNSVTLTVGTTFFSMLMICVAAYILAKYKFKGNAFIYTAVLVCGMIPTTAAMPASYRMMSNLHLIDTYVGMILLECSAFGGYFLYMHSYFKAIPWEYAESAMLDGASDLRIFFQIMIPLAKNGITTFAIMKFLGNWNEFWMAYLFYESHPTLAVGLNTLSAEATNTGAYAQLFAAMIVSIVPILIFYAIFSKQLMRNTIGGGLKG